MVFSSGHYRKEGTTMCRLLQRHDQVEVLKATMPLAALPLP